MKFFWLIGAFSLCFSVQAKGRPSAAIEMGYEETVKTQSPLPDSEASYAWLSEAEFDKNKAALQKQTRSPSSQNNVDESQMSAALRQTRDRFLGAKNADELDALISELDHKYDQLTNNDLKFFAAQIIPLQALRGIVWRLIPLFSKSKAVQSMSVTAIKSIASYQKIIFPDEQWQAGFDYVTQPFLESGSVVPQFQKEAQVIGFLASTFYIKMVQSAGRLKAISLDGKAIVWDNTTLFGKEAFKDGLNRFVLIGDAEIYSAQANVHFALSQITALRAYNNNDAITIAQSIGRLYGFDGAISSVDGISAAKRAAVMNSPRYQNYGTILSDGRAWMNLSFLHLKEAVKFSAIAWEQAKTQSRTVAEGYLFDSAALLSFQKAGNLTIENLLALIKGPANLRSGINGDLVTVNLPQFYANPPQDLKKFMPQKFAEGPQWLNKILIDAKGRTQKVAYRNYYEGRGTDWDAETYRVIFPEIKKGQEVPKNVKILSQNLGGNLLNIPLVGFID